MRQAPGTSSTPIVADMSRAAYRRDQADIKARADKKLTKARLTTSQAQAIRTRVNYMLRPADQSGAAAAWG